MAHTEDSEGKSIEWTKPPVPGAGATIGERFEYTLAEGVRRFLGLFDEPLAELGAWTLKLFFKIFEKSAGPYVKPLIDSYIDVADPDDPVANLFRQLLEPKGIAGGAMLAGLGMSGAGAGLTSILEPFFEKGRQMMYKGYPSKVFDPATALAAFWREEIGPEELNDNLERFGFDISRHSKLEEVARPRLPQVDMGAWYLRDKDREDDLRTELTARGLTTADIDRFIELLQIIPPAPDQIRMAVREAFDPSIVSAYKLDADLHKVPFDSLAKVGLDEEWARYYWYSHWVLPSVLQGYEMLHRGKIGEPELKTLMKSLDIMPGWIEHLIAISYRPYTRVDVRRMYGMGILNPDQVKKSYKDIGFDEEKAENMKDFTIGYFIEEEREATKTDILSAYFEGVISKELARELLGDIGYQELYIETYLAATDYRIEQRLAKDEEEETEEELVKERELTKNDILSAYLKKILDESKARSLLGDINYPVSIIDILIAKTDLKEMEELIDEEIKTTKTLYINKEIDLTDVHERLGKYALPATQIDKLLVLWNIERDRKTERPTPSQFLNFYMEGITEETLLREQLAKHKYSEEYIDLYVANADRIILERATKELEREQKEQERLAKAEFKTDRMLAMADLNVQIAEWKLMIAELKTVMVTVVDPGTKDQMRTQIRVKEEEIATFNVQIAEHKEEIAQAIELAPTLVEPEEIEELNAIILSLKTAIAGLEVDIAVLREEVAAIRTELSTVVEPDERLTYLEQIATAKTAIAELQLEKTQLPVVYVTPE